MRLYAPDSTVEQLAANGIGNILCSAAVVHEEINGEYSITIDVAETSAYIDDVIIGAIVKADTPRGPQLFRLSSPTTALDNGKKVFGWHISYDSAQDMIVSLGLTGKTGNEALGEILQAGISETRFTGTSDISTVNNMMITRMSILGALIGEQDGSFVNVYGGEIERDNFTINMPERLGTDTSTVIEYRKNLTGLTYEENDDELANRIIPTGLDADGAVLMLPEVYIASERISDTPIPHVRTVAFSDARVGATDDNGNVLYADSAAVYTKLRELVAEMYTKGVDVPIQSATVSFIDLSQTEEYKNFAVLQTVQIGDGVRCKYKSTDLNLRVVSYDYDSLTKKYNSIVLGKVMNTISDSLWAQDLDLSALKNEMSEKLTEGEVYNACYINHTEGFVARATIDGVLIEVKQNAQDGFAIYADGSYIGGVKVINGAAALISGMLTSGEDDNCYAVIGDSTIGGNIYRGILLYRKDYSISEFVARISAYSDGSTIFGTNTGGRLILYPDGGLIYRDQNSVSRIFFTPTGETIIRDSGNIVRMWLHSGDSYVRAPGSTNHAIGSDQTGPYYVKNGTKTYL